MSSLKGLFKHTFIYGLATVLPKLVNVGLNYLLAAYLPSTVEFGEIGAVFSYIIFANVIFSYGMETAFFRFYSDPSYRNNIIGTSLLSVLISTIVIGGLWYTFMEPWANLTDIDANYWKWVVAIVMIDALMVIPFAILRARSKSTTYSIIKLVNAVFMVVATLLFFTVLPQYEWLSDKLPTDRIELYLIAMFGASCITFLLVFKAYFTRYTFDTQLLKKMLSYGWPILVAGIAFAVNETSDKILLQHLLPYDVIQNKSQVGLYTAGYRLAIGMTLFAQAFRLGIEPFFFSQSKFKNATQQYAIITKAFVSIGAIALMIYVVCVDFLKPYLLSDMQTAMDIVPIILIAYFFSGIYQSISVWYKIQDKTFYGAIISVIAAVVTLVFNVVFIPIIGYHASAYATLIAYLLMMLASYFWGKQHLAVPYDVSSILLYLALSITGSLVFFYYVRPMLGIESTLTYATGVVMVLCMLGIICFRESEIIKQFFKK